MAVQMDVSALAIVLPESVLETGESDGVARRAVPRLTSLFYDSSNDSVVRAKHTLTSG
jgi:hypothetical protein